VPSEGEKVYWDGISKLTISTQVDGLRVLVCGKVSGVKC
jgi:hypothetical protein